MEFKHSALHATLLAGYHEAPLYRFEYARWLTGWPKAVLISSGPLNGVPRRGDDVVAIGWTQWGPQDVADGLLPGL